MYGGHDCGCGRDSIYVGNDGGESGGGNYDGGASGGGNYDGDSW